jgi:hypothetical protein
MIAMLMMASAAAAQSELRQEIAPLGFLVGHCWRGKFEARAENDTHCFDSIYGGQHVRDRHEVKNAKGEVVYAGETLYSWNGKTRRMEYTYVSSDGAVSHGSLEPKDGALDFGDETYHGPDGKELKISTLLRKAGEAAYETVSRSAANPTGQRVVRYQRVD